MRLSRQIRKQFKKKTRVYIVPTRMGGYLNGLIFLMFLMSVGYNNNLLLIFTLFLFAQNLVWLIQTHFHLHSLKFKSLSFENGHAGEMLRGQVIWEKAPEKPHQWVFTLENENQRLEMKNHQSGENHNVLGIQLPARGRWQFEHLCVSSEMPFGLYKVWVYYKSPVTIYAYPAKLKNISEIIRQSSQFEGEYQSELKGPHDVRNLSPYVLGEESRKISWKHYARSGELVVKEGEELTKSQVHFRIMESSDKEYHLSQIATQMVHCVRTDILFSLETPLKKISSDVSTKHLEECLKELTLC